MTFNGDGIDAGVVDIWKVDFHINDVVLVEMAFDNVEGVAEKILEWWWDFRRRLCQILTIKPEFV